MKRFSIDDFRLPIERMRVRHAFSSSILHPLFAFTILELLTAMAVLALVLVMLVQVVNGVLQSTRTQNQQMNSVAAARRAISVITADLQNAVVGENAAILVPDGTSSNLFVLLTSRRSASTAANPRFLAVSYATNGSNQLIRSYGSVDFSQADLLSATTNGTNVIPVEPLAKGVLAIQARAMADGTNVYALTNAASSNWATTNYNGLPPPAGFKALLTHAGAFSSALTNRTRAMEIWIAAVDDQNYQLLISSGNLPVVLGAMGSDPTAWRSAIDATAIPSQAKSGIRILNKTIPLR